MLVPGFKAAAKLVSLSKECCSSGAANRILGKASSRAGVLWMDGRCSSVGRRIDVRCAKVPGRWVHRGAAVNQARS